METKAQGNAIQNPCDSCVPWFQISLTTEHMEHMEKGIESIWSRRAFASSFQRPSVFIGGLKRCLNHGCTRMHTDEKRAEKQSGAVVGLERDSHSGSVRASQELWQGLEDRRVLKTFRTGMKGIKGMKRKGKHSSSFIPFIPFIPVSKAFHSFHERNLCCNPMSWGGARC